MVEGPVFRFLELMVGSAGGWTMSHVYAGVARSRRWRPLTPLLILVVPIAVMCLLAWTLALPDKTGFWPGAMGMAMGVLICWRCWRRCHE